MLRLVENVIGWGLDYMYVTYWTARAFLPGANARHYLTGQAGRSPIILIPGVYENWRFMKPVADRLNSAGYAVHVLETLGYNRGSIPKMADQLRKYLEAHDLREVIIVAHSKGGLIAKYALSDLRTGRRIRHVIAMNTPFSGSKYAYLFLLPSVRTFAPRHKIIRFLAQNQMINARITSLYSKFDPHIPEGSELPGATNVRLPIVGHFRPVGHPYVLELIMRRVGEIEST